VPWTWKTWLSFSICFQYSIFQPYNISWCTSPAVFSLWFSLCFLSCIVHRNHLDSSQLSCSAFSISIVRRFRGRDHCVDENSLQLTKVIASANQIKSNLSCIQSYGVNHHHRDSMRSAVVDTLHSVHCQPARHVSGASRDIGRTIINPATHSEICNIFWSKYFKHVNGVVRWSYPLPTGSDLQLICMLSGNASHSHFNITEIA